MGLGSNSDVAAAFLYPLSEEPITRAGPGSVYPGGGTAGGRLLSVLSSFAGPCITGFQKLGEGSAAGDGAAVGYF